MRQDGSLIPAFARRLAQGVIPCIENRFIFDRAYLMWYPFKSPFTRDDPQSE